MTSRSWGAIRCISWRRERRSSAALRPCPASRMRRTGRVRWAVNEELVEQFIRSKKKAPAYLILDFDATDTPVHGQQEGRFFHGYYNCHCFLPLYVFCGDQLLVAYLRKSNIDAAKHAWAILALLVKRLRAAWPRTKIVLRADSGFCRDRMLTWCDQHDVKYVVGIARNEPAPRGKCRAA